MGSNCNCDYSQLPITSQCKSCGYGPSVANPETVQKKIWYQVRAPASIYTMNYAALANTQRIKSTPPTFWNQSSDQLQAAVQTAYHPTRGNSAKATLTSSKPGSAAPAGTGVDIKHNSYNRYLNRLKAGKFIAQTKIVASKALYGNKTTAFSMIDIGLNCCK